MKEEGASKRGKILKKREVKLDPMQEVRVSVFAV
uniref:Uncharacterized protein n=1 Tax=Anguilla anguilla TaxID=7936 RepID=A0A0E9QPI6_ANGAN